MKQSILQIVLDTPLDSSFDYRWQASDDSEPTPQIGQLVQLSFGRREVVGMIVGASAESDVPAEKLKNVQAVRHQLPPLSPQWLALCRFAADYYQRPLGEVALPGLPKNLRALTTVALDRGLKKLQQGGAVHDATPIDVAQLNPAQQQAADAIAGATGFAPTLLYGVTGSGKTEVYLQAAAQILAHSDSGADNLSQILILVPEINLTPQLEGNIRARFPGVMVATLHSGLAEGERMRHWLAAHLGQARIILGTRLAVLASLPHLKLIVIDEEHDPSYKQQEGLRYSARDLAVWRAHQLGIPIVLGSATPSLETWQHTQSGRYRKLELRERAVKDAVLPLVRRIDMERDKPSEGLTSTLVSALKQRLERGEQSLLFLNRRGFAPVLHCPACTWKSGCPHCSAWRVFHKGERILRCHHCGTQEPVPRACPDCGNLDIEPMGRGTERLEEQVAELLPGARVLRIDADTTRAKGTLESQLAAVHEGAVDVLVGTQMVTKGHDFRRVTLVAAVNPDGALFAADFRAPERLFALLMQAGGRAGRDADIARGSEMWVQTYNPGHALFEALKKHDFAAFAATQLAERASAGLPPYSHLALLRAEAKTEDVAEAFLRAARELAKAYPEAADVMFYAPVPPSVAKVAGFERRQMLIECASRATLQRLLALFTPELPALKTSHRGIVRWAIDVDPLGI